MAFAGAEKIAIDERGDLVLKRAGGHVRLRKPRVYQDINGRQREIEGRYLLHPQKASAKTQVGLQVAAYDTANPLVIDPVLDYSTYLGGSNGDVGVGIAVDVAGNAYVTGTTTSTDFPTVNPLQGSLAGGVDVFVAKLNAEGSALVYSTYLGGGSAGASGRADDLGVSIAVDVAGNTYITGTTNSTDFPTVNPLQGSLAGSSDAFVSKLNADGSALVYSTYLGGGSGGAFGRANDRGESIAVDVAGNAYITGAADSTNFPTVNPLQGSFAGSIDAFVAKLNADGSALVYSTYLGGASGGGFSLASDTGNGIAVDGNGNAYITGVTGSTDFPTANPLQGSFSGVYDAFVAKFNPEGSALVYSSYLGGSGFDRGHGIAVDGAGNAYITGLTNSTDFPSANPLQASIGGRSDIFIAELNPEGSAFVYSTYLGGTDSDSGNGIAVDGAGNVYVTGDHEAVQDGPHTASVAKLNVDGSALVYRLSLQGNGSEGGNSIAVDSASNAYVTGGTSSTDFPTTNPVQGSIAGSADAFVAKISDTAPPPPQPILSVTPPSSLDFGTVTVGSSGDLTFTVTNTGAGTLTGTTSSSAPFSIVSGGSFSLAAGASQAVVVRFSPTATGSFTANVSFTSNGGNASQVVTGAGAAAPAISVTPTPLAFGSVAVGSSADLTFTVDNTGGGTLSGTCSTNAPFSLPNGCSFNLTSGQTAVVTVRFSPTGTGPFTGNVSFTSNGGDVSSAVTGTGTVKPRLTISSISPTSGLEGTVVTIKGRKFGANQGSSFVSFGSAQAAINSWSDTQIVAIAPSGPSGLVRVTVTTAAGTSNSKDFTYTTAGSTILFQWPLDDADVSNLNQDYAQFNGIGTHLYHTGLDIGAALNTTVKASADGNIVMIQENDVGCTPPPNKKGDCQDHGYGNTVIIEHGSMLYSHYSHLNFIEENLKNACPTESKKWKGRDSKRRFCSISINAGDKLGGVGGSGYGQPACTTPGQTDCYTFPHLHFEIKTFSTLGTTGNDNGEFGYTSKHPDDVKYIDPILELHNLAQASFSRSVSIIENGVNLRVGPGGLGTAEYRVLTTINIGTYKAIRESAGTSKPDCPSGWYQIRRSSGRCAIAGNCFVDNSDPSSSVPDAWVCRKFISE